MASPVERPAHSLCVEEQEHRAHQHQGFSHHNGRLHEEGA